MLRPESQPEEACFWNIAGHEIVPEYQAVRKKNEYNYYRYGQNHRNMKIIVDR
jgi:hypothetical protein